MYRHTCCTQSRLHTRAYARTRARTLPGCVPQVKEHSTRALESTEYFFYEALEDAKVGRSGSQYTRALLFSLQLRFHARTRFPPAASHGGLAMLSPQTGEATCNMQRHCDVAGGWKPPHAR